ncbi:MAG: PQQ-dependent sugar dehydrogenase, partial [Bryobacteraceae bacterium]
MRRWIAVFACALNAAEFPAISLYRVLGGFDLPVDVASPRDGSGRLFVVQQRGLIRVVKNGTILPDPFLDIRSSVSCCGERGLLGLAFPPGYADKRYFYINYTNLEGNSVIARVHLGAGAEVADPATTEILLTVAQPFANHNGGGLAFGPRDGFLYIGLGDGGSAGDPQNNAQRTDTLLGKMLRIDVESGIKPYSVPATNPFVNRSGYRPEIWATGLRNPWRYSFDRETGEMFIADVG